MWLHLRNDNSASNYNSNNNNNTQASSEVAGGERRRTGAKREPLGFAGPLIIRLRAPLAKWSEAARMRFLSSCAGNKSMRCDLLLVAPVPTCCASGAFGPHSGWRRRTNGNNLPVDMAQNSNQKHFREDDIRRRLSEARGTQRYGKMRARLCVQGRAAEMVTSDMRFCCGRKKGKDAAQKSSADASLMCPSDTTRRSILLERLRALIFQSYCMSSQLMRANANSRASSIGRPHFLTMRTIANS